MAAKDGNEGKNNLKEWLIGTPAAPGLLKQLGMPVETLADKMRLRKATLYYFLDDTNRPSPESLSKLCQAVGVSLEEGLKYVDTRSPGRPKTKPAPIVTKKKRPTN